MLRPLIMPHSAAQSGGGVLGGEASSWGESADAWNSDERVFHRVPAVAERLWSSAQQTVNEESARVRKAELRCKLLSGLGIRAGPVFPDYCDAATPGVEGGVQEVVVRAQDA